VRNKKGEGEKFSQNKKIVFVAIPIVVILILAGLFFLFQPKQASQPKAAIIDQLSSSQLSPSSQHRNETFVNEATELLYKRFSEVDYYSDNATVDQYARLPSLGYKLILWRAHSALDPENYTAICSSEKYEPGKYDQYSEDQLKLCNITGDQRLYFAITPYFIKECMSGSFEDTVIILMSCNGLKKGYYKTAEAFVEKGVKVFISWDGWIDPNVNDDAVAHLLDYLINKNDTVGVAVNKIPPSYSSEFGWSELHYYPPDVADYHIPNYRQNDVSNNSGFMIIPVLRKNLDVCWTRLAGSLDALIVSRQPCIVGCEEHHQSN
jgi:hypothetical protein